MGPEAMRTVSDRRTRRAIRSNTLDKHMDILCGKYTPDSSKGLGAGCLKSAIAVWYAFVPERGSACERYAALLSHEERQRAAAFRFPRDRARFVYAHGLLRMLAGRLLNAPPGRLAFHRKGNGKPFLAPPHERLFFSLSHARDLVACAFSLRCPVGADVECQRCGWEFLPLVRTLFHEREAHAIASAPSASAARKTFFDVWTRKEAFLKATGEGLSRPLDSFCVLSSDGAVLEKTPEGALRPGRWRVRQCTLDAQYSMAVAYPHGDSKGFDGAFPERRTDAVPDLGISSCTAPFLWDPAA